jgi:hypothetical protein
MFTLYLGAIPHVRIGQVLWRAELEDLNDRSHE